MSDNPRRAITPERKREIVERILTAWEQAPQQRLGQLIDNALRFRAEPHADLFGVEDTDLTDAIEAFARLGGGPSSEALARAPLEDEPISVDEERRAAAGRGSVELKRSSEDLEKEAEQLARQTWGVSAPEAWARVKAGELEGTLFASKMMRLYALLGEPEPPKMVPVKPWKVAAMARHMGFREKARWWFRSRAVPSWEGFGAALAANSVIDWSKGGRLWRTTVKDIDPTLIGDLTLPLIAEGLHVEWRLCVDALQVEAVSREVQQREGRAFFFTSLLNEADAPHAASIARDMLRGIARSGVRINGESYCGVCNAHVDRTVFPPDRDLPCGHSNRAGLIHYDQSRDIREFAPERLALFVGTLCSELLGDSWRASFELEGASLFWTATRDLARDGVKLARQRVEGAKTLPEIALLPPGELAKHAAREALRESRPTDGLVPLPPEPFSSS
jgi:hypothetical protein